MASLSDLAAALRTVPRRSFDMLLMRLLGPGDLLFDIVAARRIAMERRHMPPCIVPLKHGPGKRKPV